MAVKTILNYTLASFLFSLIILKTLVKTW